MAEAATAGGMPALGTPVRTEARSAKARTRPNPLPSRLAFGVGALAAVSVIGAGIGRLSGGVAAAPVAPDPVTAIVASAAPERRTRVERPIRYVRLKPGQKAPAGARVIQEKAPAPRVVVRWVSSGSPSSASSAPARRAPVAQTRQSGRMTLLDRAPHPEVPDERARLERSLEFGAMGGRVRLHVSCRPEEVTDADRDLRRVAGRIGAWADRLTRFSPSSDLSALNRQAEAAESAVRPTLSALLCRSLSLAERTEGNIDVGMLGARLAAEAGDAPPAPAPWTVQPSPRGGVVRREGTVWFDLDGVGKGWIADRALDLLQAYPAALVDADGDIALRPGRDTAWTLAVADPAIAGQDIAMLDLRPHRHPGRLGVATSGTSVHRWPATGGDRHHSIDPRTGRPAVTDVVQATVIAEGALVAEALAKAIVIRGSDEGLDLAERAGAYGELLSLEGGEVIASPRTLEWLV